MTVLLLGDITGRSRVALRMLSAVLEEKGHEVLMLPTALISNTLNLGMHESLDTTDYLMRSLEVWEKLGLHYDVAYMGYITGMEQAKALASLADTMRKRGVRVIVDPILGDNGKKYNSVSQEQAEGMKLLCAHADLITPNLTEACLLADVPYGTAQGAQLGHLLFGEGDGRLAIPIPMKAHQQFGQLLAKQRFPVGLIAVKLQLHFPKKTVQCRPVLGIKHRVERHAEGGERLRFVGGKMHPIVKERLTAVKPLGDLRRIDQHRPRCRNQRAVTAP